ncbi:MAG: sugar nucleotide-binding protein [Candidatus Buchananbacteria bacterium]
MKILIIGNGYVGSRCAKEWPDAVVSDKMINNLEDALSILNEHNPDVVLNAAGIIGRPNVDWCETHQFETFFGNAILPIIIAQACAQKNVYLLHIGSGCIFYGESPDPKGWKETDFANPSATYSRAKYAADLALSMLPNVGIARIRMPMESVPFPGNIIDKLALYSKIIDVENSLTVIEDMIKVFRQLLEKKAAGIFHVTNPGSIKHKEIIALYKELVDPSYETEWINEDELVSRGLAVKKRSSNILQSENLAKFGIEMRPAKEAARDCMVKYAKAKLGQSA